MPRYYVDFQDGDELHEDDEGTDLPDHEAARKQAVATLPQIAKDELPDGEHRKFVATVRDSDGRPLYQASLTFHGRWLE